MRNRRAKRAATVAAALLSLGATGTFVAGVTFGLFSSAGHVSGNNTFTAGVVSFGSPVSTTCAITPMSPGDASTGWSPAGSNATCTYQVTFSGNVPAFLGLDLTITGAAGTPVAPYGGSTPSAASGLFDGTANGLQLLVTDSATNFVNNTTYQNQAGTPVSLSSTSSVTDLLISRTASTNGATDTITVNYKLPTSASNAYNSASSTIVLVIHAVQANNNALPVGCAAGNVCSSGFNWS
ncbi:MAG: hypothetical protein QOF30_1710 [Acidimicrobiaceae bacterium]|jgi:hypothetical protein|nr:hypothetical protein [Acidimicrobiaceae bacterium]